MIKQYIGEDHRRWDENLPELQFAINTSIQDSTGFSAAQLNFGRELRKPNTVYHDLELDLTTNPVDGESLSTRMKDMIALVRTNIAKASTQQAKYYNLRRRAWFPELGERVYKKLHPQSSAPNNFAAKLAPSYAGPFIVYNYVSPTVIELKELRDGHVSPKVYRTHIKDLKALSH